jgi:hypothetical protein
MKLSSVFLAPSLAPLVSAFPTHQPRNLDAISPLLDGLFDTINSLKPGNLPKINVIDPKKPIDITGKHAFQAPGNRDHRGPCPGLNALANHGYISRSGITSFVEVVNAINQGTYKISC